MQRFYATAALSTALALITPQGGQVFAASPDTTQTPEQTVPQGNDPPGADNGEQSGPATQHKGVITPPKTGDEEIYTQAPNPNAGTEEEVIPPPGTPGSEQPNVEPR
jgi:hypothetical protein